MVNIKNDLQKLQKWREEEFLPWQQAVTAYHDEQARVQQMVRQHAASFKQIVAFLLDGDAKKAVELWNSIGMRPTLAEIKVMDKDILRLVGERGRVQMVLLDNLLADLQKLLK